MAGRQPIATVNPARQAALLFTFLGTALIGFVVATWESPLAGRVALSIGGRAEAGIPLALLLGAAVSLIGAAVMMARHVHRASIDGVLRDPASGLYRTGYVAEAVTQLTADDDREQRSRLALILIEIDFLEPMRQRYGRSAVDELLACVGRHVRGQARENDLPMRDGGRFAVYLRCEELEQANAFSRRLSMLLSAEQYELQGDVIKVSVSIGAAMRSTGEALDSLQQRAAACLNATRTAGTRT